MKLTDKEKNTMHQYLDRFCNEVDIDQDNGAHPCRYSGERNRGKP